MSIDLFPNVDEFGPGSCTCSGTMTGCAVCSTANILLRYGKTIPRLANGTPDMRGLGARMGSRHRAVASTGSFGDRHGLSLHGQCTGGTNWCAKCAHLELRANGLPAAYAQLSWSTIEYYVNLKRPMTLPGLYGRVPYVSPSSYSASVPARGRSDSGFTSAHMVTLWQVNSRYSSNGEIRDFVVSDPDFGSPSRPVVPPHSIWTRATARNYWAALGWSVCFVNKAPPTVAPPTAGYKAQVPAGDFLAYKVADGEIEYRRTRRTGGFSAGCTAPRSYRWPDKRRTATLVRLTSGSRAGMYISANYSRRI